MKAQSSSNDKDESLLRIMIATDNHLGYLENDQTRGDDSFNTFDEILKVSKKEGVDFLLLGGDLFHHHNPSKKTIIRASNILQSNVFGQKQHNFEVFCYQPNFKNENLAIELPIFIIHGNHDDPSGFDNFSSIDIFSGKEVNYFGKINNHEEFDLYPILFTKGSTKFALYGIGNIKDERLFLALQNKKVNFHRPEDFKEWFNVLIVHQNRFKGHHAGKNKKNYLPESFIPAFIDLVIWGHEHECFTQAVYNSEVGLHVYQPGSSVVTSLIQAESKQKHIGLLEVYLEKFRIVPIKLNTVRPFLYQTIELKTFGHRINDASDIEKLIEEKIVEMLNESKSLYPNHPLIPILRLKVESSGYNIIRTNHILSKFSGKIANPNEVIQFYKKLETLLKQNGHNIHDFDLEDNHSIDIEEELQDHDGEVKKFVNDSIKSYFVEKQKRCLISPDLFTESLEQSVNGQEKKTLDLLFNSFFEKASYSANLTSDSIRDIPLMDTNKRDISPLIENILGDFQFTSVKRNEKIRENKSIEFKLAKNRLSNDEFIDDEDLDVIMNYNMDNNINKKANKMIQNNEEFNFNNKKKEVPKPSFLNKNKEVSAIDSYLGKPNEEEKFKEEAKKRRFLTNDPKVNKKKK